MKFLKLVGLLSLVIMASACAGPSTHIRHSSDFASTLSKKNTIGVLPTKANVTMVDIGGNSERMYDYEQYIEPIVQDALITALTEKGYNAKRIHNSDLKKNKLYRNVEKIRTTYHDKLSSIFGVNTGKSEAAFNITEKVSANDAKAVKKNLNYNLLLIPHYNESSKTNGARARDFAMDALFGSNSAAIAELSRIGMTIIDTKDGSILWTHSAGDTSSLYGSVFSNTGDPEKVAHDKTNKLVKKLMKDFPDKSNIFESQAKEATFFEKK